MTEEKSQEEKTIGSISLTMGQFQELGALLDIVRQKGTRREAVLALNWMTAIEKTLNAQMESSKVADASEGDKTSDEVEAEKGIS